MLRKERRGNQIKHSKLQKAEKEWKENRIKNETNTKKRVTNMVDVNPSVNTSVVTLNVNSLMHQLKEIVRVDQKPRPS